MSQGGTIGRKEKEMNQKKITGAERVAAKFNPAWKSPSEAAPSPKKQIVQALKKN